MDGQYPQTVGVRLTGHPAAGVRPERPGRDGPEDGPPLAVQETRPAAPTKKLEMVN